MEVSWELSSLFPNENRLNAAKTRNIKKKAVFIVRPPYFTIK
jgi:hypothetical protein